MNKGRCPWSWQTSSGIKEEVLAVAGIARLLRGIYCRNRVRNEPRFRALVRGRVWSRLGNGPHRGFNTVGAQYFSKKCRLIPRDRNSDSPIGYVGDTADLTANGTITSRRGNGLAHHLVGYGHLGSVMLRSYLGGGRG